MIIYADTPKGLKQHGTVINNTFVRSVKAKDLMRIFDAWSINPEALEEIKKAGVKDIVYNDTKKGLIYSTTVEEMELNGFEKTFSGGLTRYLLLKYWKVTKGRKE